VANVKTSVEAWLDAGLDALGGGGPDAVRIETLARTLGVTKGGFYWHFPDRPTYLGRVLDRWEQRAVEDVIARVESHDASPRDRLRELFGLATAFVGDGGITVELAVRDWARRDPDVAARLAGVDERRMDYLRTLFRQITTDELEAEARCLVAYALYIGTHFVAAEHPGQTREAVMARALEDLLR
jgi:AcrR family transcriptional regulator